MIFLWVREWWLHNSEWQEDVFTTTPKHKQPIASMPFTRTYDGCIICTGTLDRCEYLWRSRLARWSLFFILWWPKMWIKFESQKYSCGESAATVQQSSFLCIYFTELDNHRLCIWQIDSLWSFHSLNWLQSPKWIWVFLSRPSVGLISWSKEFSVPVWDRSGIKWLSLMTHLAKLQPCPQRLPSPLLPFFTPISVARSLKRLEFYMSV